MTSSKLIEVCQRIGRRIPIWTQGPGGNVSLKEVDQADPSQWLWIKASGTRLDRVSVSSGLAKAELASLRAQLDRVSAASEDREEKYAQALAAASIVGPGLGRLSMEAGFHAKLPRRWVVHFHSLAALLMAELQRTEPARWSEWLLGASKLRVQVMPAELPGLCLSESVGAYPKTDIFLLVNHGVILHSEDEAMIDQWSELELKFCGDFGFHRLKSLLLEESPLAAAQRALGEHAAPLRLYFPDSAVFLDRLKGILVPRGGGFALAETAWEKNPDAAEIWLATLALHDACPTLAELPADICSQVAQLPMEQWRRATTQGWEKS